MIVLQLSHLSLQAFASNFISELQWHSAQALDRQRERRRSAGLASSSRTPPGPRIRACAAAGQQATPRNAGARGPRSGLCSGVGSCFKPPFKESQRGSDICCCLLRGLCTHSAAGRQCPRTASAQKGHMQRRMQPRLRGNAPGQQALRSGPCGGW